MLNEQLVKLIQDGNNQYITELWSQVEAFISLQAYKALNQYPENYKYLHDDMVNEAYFYFLKAIDGYKEDSGASFLTYLTYHLKNCYKKVIYGGVTKRAMSEPLNEALSIYIPISEEQTTLADTLIDEKSEAYYRHIEDADFWEDVNRVLKLGIAQIEGKPGQILQVMFDNDLKLTEVQKNIDPTQPYTQYRYWYEKGIRHLRRFLTTYIHKSQNRNSCIEDYISYNYGTNRTLCSGISSVEYAVMKKVDRDLKYADMLYCINT